VVKSFNLTIQGMLSCLVVKRSSYLTWAAI